MQLNPSTLATNAFYWFASTAQEIAATRGMLAKTEVMVHYLRQLEDPNDLELAVRYFTEGAFAKNSGRSAAVGHATILQAAVQFLDMDADAVFKPCRTATGSTSETLGRLVDYWPAAQDKRTFRQFTLQEIEEYYAKIDRNRIKSDKIQLLHQAWSGMSAVEIVYFLRVLTQGSLRIGFEEKAVMNALAKVFELDAEQIRTAWMLTGSTGETARLCKENRLQQADFRLFHPLAFMLASPVESRVVDDWSGYVMEDKFDGMRCQLHADGAQVHLYSRDLNEITTPFPDLVASLRDKNLPPLVLDGELCVFREGMLRPFQELQRRMGNKKPSSTLMSDFPVMFIAYDLLYLDQSLWVHRPLTERRRQLEALAQRYGIACSQQRALSDAKDIERGFAEAVDRGNEGLMLKHGDSLYEFGQRRKSWLKVKQPGGSLDTVILYATAGSGKRGGVWSDFTLALRVDEDERFEQAWVPVGKAYGGYTNEDLQRINTLLRTLVVERYGPTVAVEPQLVVEIEFDEIQVNARTKAGYTLRFPRFKAIRWDKPAYEANTLRDLEQMYELRLRQDRQRSHQALLLHPPAESIPRGDEDTSDTEI
jgi:DNA ligase-1